MKERGEGNRHDLSKRESRLVKTAVFLSIFTPSLAMALVTGYLSANLKLNTISFHFDQDLIGVTGQDYSGNNCHMGIHPGSGNKDVHLYCQNPNITPYQINSGQGTYYKTIISNMVP